MASRNAAFLRPGNLCLNSDQKDIARALLKVGLNAIGVAAIFTTKVDVLEANIRKARKARYHRDKEAGKT